MPLRDASYQHWIARSGVRSYRWIPITRQGIALLVRKKRFVALMLLSAIPFLVRASIVYLSSALGRSISSFVIDASFFNDFLNQQMFFTLMIAIYAGAGIVANDLKANALQIYFSRPITKLDYVLGKLGVLFFFLAGPTLFLALALYLIAMMFGTNLEFLRSHLWIPASIIGYSLVIIATHAVIVLGLSALTKSSRFAGIAFAAIFLFSQILATIMSVIFRDNSLAWVSLRSDLSQIGDYFFGIAPRIPNPVWISGVVLGVAGLASIAVIRRRVRAVEVVR